MVIPVRIIDRAVLDSASNNWTSLIATESEVMASSVKVQVPSQVIREPVRSVL
ncbi:MAG: hypothetical protein ABIR84_07715 [Candidatus Nitrotoga sp.]